MHAYLARSCCLHYRATPDGSMRVMCECEVGAYEYHMHTHVGVYVLRENVVYDQVLMFK